MPAGTATMPIRKQVTNSASGQNHQGKALEGTTLSPANAGMASNRSISHRNFKARVGRQAVIGDRSGSVMVGGEGVAGWHGPGYIAFRIVMAPRIWPMA
jgi:hypothetical protein